MIQDIKPDFYHVEYDPMRRPEGRDFFTAVNGRSVFMRKEGESISFITVAESGFEPSDLIYAFALDDRAFFIPSPFKFKEADLTDLLSGVEGGFWTGRDTFRQLRPMSLAFCVVTAMQLSNWYRSRAYCGRCGKPMEHSKTERAMVCHECGLVEYPKLCPACIIGVIDGDRIVMSKYAGREYTHYALLAGFCELGESFEDSIRREVMEEVGLHVKNIRYYGSQPWALSDTMLAGFYCELDGDDTIHVDESELSCALWRHRDEIDLAPHDISLTNEMIQVFKRNLWDGTTRDVLMGRNDGKVF